MRTPSPLPTLVLILAMACPAQRTAAIPAPLGDALPGNAAVSAPLRWERGMIQVIYQASVLPNGFGAGTTVTGITLRRPAFVDEPAYGAVTRSLRVWMASTTRGVVGPSTRGNYVGTPVEVVPLTTMQIGASQPTGPGDAVGSDLLFLPFTTAFTVGTQPNLFLQIEMHGPTFAVANDNWVDAVWFPAGADEGFATHVGNGGCAAVQGTRSRLVWNGPDSPAGGTTASVLASGLAPLAPVFFAVQPNPQASTLPFGSTLSTFGAPACFLWGEPLDAFFQFTDASGRATWSAPLPGGVAGGLQFGIQAFNVADLSQPVPRTTNGIVMLTEPAGIGPAVSTLMHTDVPVFPVPANPQQNYVSPIAPFPGLAPVVQLHFQ